MKIYIDDTGNLADKDPNNYFGFVAVNVSPVIEQEIVQTFTNETITSERIKALLSNKNWTQPKLVEEMQRVASEQGINTDIKLNRIGGWFSHGSKPNPDNLKLLAKVFGVEESDIVPGR